jgi:ectoine hydroxylase-related dioxygenase (phytanoyl-CoA dioxygenase family)
VICNSASIEDHRRVHAFEIDAKSFEKLGFHIIPAAIPPQTVEDVRRSLEITLADENTGRTPGTRNLAVLNPTVALLANSSEILALLASLGLPGAFLVRSILFDKQPGANWKVAWHQDLSIAVRERLEIQGYGPWSQKADVPHVQPPISVLGRMITLRLHIDDCDSDNGALRVIPGSHRHGVLNAEKIRSMRDQHAEFICAVPKGGILAMRPLLLHASSMATKPAHRRVVHLEYAADELPSGLRWFNRRQHI